MPWRRHPASGRGRRRPSAVGHRSARSELGPTGHDPRQRRGVDGDPSIADLGTGISVRSKDGSRAVGRVDVAPNHTALADRFTLFDNFYCDSDQSNTGHRWVVGVYPNEWVEVNARSRIEARLFSSAPGRRYVNGTSATVLPEDYNEAGALWEHLTRNRVSFYNFGFGTEMPASLEQQMFKETGIRMTVSFPLPKPLFDHTSRIYPTFNMAIPDHTVSTSSRGAARAVGERKERCRSADDVLPKITGHGIPEGYPFRECICDTIWRSAV